MPTPWIRAATLHDLPRLVALERECFEQETPWNEAALRAELERAHARVIVAAPDTQTLDARTIDAYGVYWIIEKESELLRLATRPAERRRGLGQALLRHWLDEVQVAHARAWLEVRKGNVAALALYQGAGFRVVAERPRYYPDGDSALVLERLVLER